MRIGDITKELEKQLAGRQIDSYIFCADNGEDRQIFAGQGKPKDILAVLIKSLGRVLADSFDNPTPERIAGFFAEVSAELTNEIMKGTNQ